MEESSGVFKSGVKDELGEGVGVFTDGQRYDDDQRREGGEYTIVGVEGGWFVVSGDQDIHFLILQNGKLANNGCTK